MRVIDKPRSAVVRHLIDFVLCALAAASVAVVVAIHVLLVTWP